MEIKPALQSEQGKNATVSLEDTEQSGRSTQTTAEYERRQKELLEEREK